MKEVVKLEAYNIEQLVNLSGVKDENLEVLEDHFQVEISLRGDEMTLVGEKENLEKNPYFNKYRKGIETFKDKPIEIQEKLIEKNE